MSDSSVFDEFFIQLPSDPEEAFIVYHKRCLDDFIANDSDNSGYYYHREFADKILAFDEVYGLGLFSNWPQPPNENGEFSEFFWPFKRATEKAALKFQLERARRASTSERALVVFDVNSRKAIHQLIDAVREELGRLELTESKRASLFAKLNSFAHEVDQNLSRTEAAFRLAVELGQMAKDAGDTLKPVTDRIDRILDMIDRAQTWAESLPPWGKRKEIPAPPKQIEGPRSNDGTDDDIPF